MTEFQNAALFMTLGLCLGIPWAMAFHVNKLQKSLDAIEAKLDHALIEEDEP